jgi:hypothetical protein
MLRLAIHQGTHIHLESKFLSRKALQEAQELLGKHHSANPTATPSRLKNILIGDLLAQVQSKSAIGLTEDQENKLWEMLKGRSTSAKFMSLLRSV